MPRPTTMDLYHFISASQLFSFSPPSPLQQRLSIAAFLWLYHLPELATLPRAGRSLPLGTEQGSYCAKGRMNEQCTRPRFPLNVCLTMPLGPRLVKAMTTER